MRPGVLRWGGPISRGQRKTCAPSIGNCYRHKRLPVVGAREASFKRASVHTEGRSSSPSHTPRGSAALRRTPQLFPCERLFPGRRPPPSALPRPCRRRGRPGPRPGRRRPRYASSPHQRATLRALPADPAHTRRAPTSSATTQRTPRGHTVRRALRPLAAPTRLCYPPLHRNRRSSPS